MSETGMIGGLVIRTHSGFFTVKTEKGNEVVCQVRGRLLKERRKTTPVALGDRVLISHQPDGRGMIEDRLPRDRAFARQTPSAETKLPDREKVIIANPDQVVLVFACAFPEPKSRTLDRYLVIAESQKIPVIICANKIDLVPQEQAKAFFGIYEALGYTVLYTCATEGKGVDQLREMLQGRISALTGPSGAGKSSLLNAIQSGLGLAVGAVSETNLKGKHTTVSSQLFPLDAGGYVADTPGIKSIGLFNIEPSELDGYFPEIRVHIDNCQYRDCHHVEEPGCAVTNAVKEGSIPFERYDSYLRLREECEEIYYRC